MNTWKRLLSVVACGTVATLFSAVPTIVLPDNPTAIERAAAEELADGFKRMLKLSVPMISEAAQSAPSSPAFFIGSTRASRAVRGDCPWRTDGVYLKSVANGLVLDGEPVRGVFYAVDVYLEKYCGVRWWTSTASHYPRLEKLPVEEIALDYAPPFAYRETYYLDGFDPRFKVRSKGNFTSLTRYMLTSMDFIPPELGGNHRLYFFKGRRSAYHSFFEILPPTNYFKAHPAWYSLVKGKRVPKQLCLANEEMKKAYIAETRRRLAEDASVDFIQVSQNDWNGACECERCKAMEAEDGGTAAGPYLRFANEVAAAIEPDFPKVRVDTFAYQFTRRAPTKTRPRHNVVVRLCDIECDYSTPLAEKRFPKNAEFVKDLEDWSKIAPGRFFIWDYLANFKSYMVPHPNIGSIAPNIRLFASVGAAGVYEQGDALCRAGNFAPLRHYLVSHLLWNPAADEHRLMTEFLEGYYGKAAAPHLAKYLDLIEKAARSKHMFVRCWHDRAEFLAAEDTLAADELMQAALEAAKKDGPNAAARVRRESLSLDHQVILEWKKVKACADGKKLAWRRPSTRAGAVERWISACEDFGVLTHRETVSRDVYFDYIAKLRQEAGCRAWQLGEKYQQTRAPEDRFAWIQALEQEEHDFSHRCRSLVDERGVYKFNRESKLYCLSLRRTNRPGCSWDEDLGEDGKLHVEWKRKENGGIEYHYAAPTNWDVFVSAYPGEVTRYGVKVMKSRTGMEDPMPQVTLSDGWRVVAGEEYSGVNVREAYLTFEKDGLGLPPPVVSISWPGAGVRAVYGASNVVVAAEGATFVPVSARPPTAFSTPLAKRGTIASAITHHVKGMQAGPHRKVPYPANEIKAARNFVFAMRDALGRLGYDRKDSLPHGGLWLGGFDSNYPNGHTDFPAHFHICVPCRDGNQVHHFYMRPEDGRVTWDCHQDMSKVMDIWDRVFRFVPGDAFPVYDGDGRVAFNVRILEGGEGFEFERSGFESVRACGARPCDAVEVLVKDDGKWRRTASYSIADDPAKGELTTPEGVIRYNPDTGAEIR